MNATHPMLLFQRRLPSILLFVAFLPLASAAQSPFPDLRVEKKAGQQTGPVLVSIDGKSKRLTQHAFQAWPVMNGQNALVLLLPSNDKRTDKYLLRFYEGATRKYRNLGMLPFSSAELLQRKQSDGSWAFVLSGTVNGVPHIAVADTNALRGRLQNATAPQLGPDGLTFHSRLTNETKTLAMKSLLGKDMSAIYEIHSSDAGVRYVQFPQDGNAVVSEANGHYHTGPWFTDGETMFITESNGAQFAWPRTSLAPVEGVSAGTRLNVRLLQPLSSLKVKKGDAVAAVLISTAAVGGRVLIPQGSRFVGVVAAARAVNWL